MNYLRSDLLKFLEQAVIALIDKNEFYSIGDSCKFEQITSLICKQDDDIKEWTEWWPEIRRLKEKSAKVE